MALDPSLVAAQSDSSIPRLDHNSHTTYPNAEATAIQPTSSSPSIGNPISTASFMEPTTQDDPTIAQSSPSPVPDSSGASASDGDTTTALNPDVDPQILEALKSKDRIYVLKLGETFEALIMERRQRVELTPATSYQRLLVHRCSAYYRLAPENDPVTKGIFVLATADSRIPDRRICELVPAESTTHPAFKIMRRSVLERRSKPHSHAGSVAGEDQELSDVEQSESGSQGGRSNLTSSRDKKRMTIEEREAAYNEARSRIFMDFEEKEKGKDKDMSASSSTLSLNGSASTSAGGRSSVGDMDDAASSPATESEWSVPSGSNSREKRDGRRGGPGGASASSSRPLRNGGSFQGNGSGGSSRNSRAPSPSFSYASLHDSPTGQIYDPSQQHGPNPGYYTNQFGYPYSPPSQGPSPPFLAPYPYYPQHYNPYQSPPLMPQHNPADPTTPSGHEPYSPPHQMNYAPQYAWPPHPQQPPLQSPPHTMHMSLPPQQPQQNTHPVGPPSLPSHSSQYQPFVHPGHNTYTYPMNGYYAPPPPPAPGQQIPPPPAHINMQQQQPQQQQQQQQQPQHQHQHQQHQHQHQQHQHQHQQHHQHHQHPSYDVPRGGMNGNQIGQPPNGQHFNNSANSNGPRHGLGNGVIPPNNNGRTTSRNGTGPDSAPMGVNGSKHRVQPPASARSAWSYGPGVGMGGYTAPMHSAGGDAVGPRFNNSNRRMSGNSSSGGNSRASSNCDDVSSTSSSTTSSSSRRTFTSTTSSQHPLPPRPDWAVGLKAQPTLAGGRHHDLSLSNSRTMSPISPPRSNGHNSPMPSDNNSPRQPSSSQHTPPISLQAMDFPPLTSAGATQEKRTPVVTGAWGNSRPILSSANGNVNASGNIASAQHSPVAKQEENERGVVERQSPKVPEIFNPKLVRRPPTVNGQGLQRAPGDRSKESVAVKGDSVASPTAMAGQVAAMSLGDETGVEISNTENAPSAPSPSREKESSVVAPAPPM
ncbi:hypothetical protein BDZ97DRAFT_500749 [Flammula alnicola]|nr:hypothetical protein BDZ97DRAFT_500749 [Flammula alnicola]